MKITVVGGGYVGLVTGACFADAGHDVTIIEVDPVKTALINAGKSPIFEPGLDEILRLVVGRNLRAGLSFDPVGSSDMTFICVGTPPNDDGSANLSFIESASRSIGEALRTAGGYHVVVVKSTVPPGTMEKLVLPLVLAASGGTEDRIGFAVNPEFLREGRAIGDFRQPDRIVIGSRQARAGDLVARVYRDFTAPVVRTGLAAAEMIKYASNAFLATKISFANEIGNICKEMDIDVYEVMQGVGFDQRIGPRFLNAGAGFGGSCLLEKRAGDLAGRRIAVLGLAFKENTDDVRDSRAIPVIRDLLGKRAQVIAFDPMAVPNMRKIFPEIEYTTTAQEALNGAEGCIVMTEWPEFTKLSREFDGMKQKIVIEGRRILSWNGAEGICW